MIAAKTRGVAGSAVSTGRVRGEIQEELKHPSDCWSAPVCWVWSDSRGGVQTSMGTQGVWERKVYPSVLGVGWSVKARRTLTMGTFAVSHVG